MKTEGMIKAIEHGDLDERLLDIYVDAAKLRIRKSVM